jgi:hypothetical protein
MCQSLHKQKQKHVFLQKNLPQSLFVEKSDKICGNKTKSMIVKAESVVGGYLEHWTMYDGTRERALSLETYLATGDGVCSYNTIH